MSTPASSHGAAMHPVRQRGRALAIVRGTLATQSVVTGWGGLIAIFLGDLTATGGRQWVLLAAGVAGGGAALLGVAAGLWALRASLLNGQARWTITVLAIEAALVPAGWLMMGLWTSATPAAGTDGPFADGAAGAIAVSGFVYTYGGGLIVAAVTWIYLRGRFGSS